MGAKPEFVRRLALEIYNKYRDRVSRDFEENKKLVKEVLNIPSKKVRNIVAGYLTRIKKMESKR
ncbi:30S ribosomal protein S17e [Candidatus Geothermarchaeota archaeon]|nr:MAG: 30S ribosomal protein S17e [Candidatus Geothermarchaeota archaeon]HEW94057.1 30S ribosomal protein S17e [Thermoprotei archaeon]